MSRYLHIYILFKKKKLVIKYIFISQIDQTLIQFCLVIKKNIADYRSVFPFSGHTIIIHVHVNLPAGAFFSRFWGSLPSTFKIFRTWKKSSTKKSWPTFCDQYFWKFPIWNSRADEKHREIRMVKVNVIFNDIRLLICLTPLQVNWVMLIN